MNFREGGLPRLGALVVDAHQLLGGHLEILHDVVLLRLECRNLGRAILGDYHWLAIEHQREELQQLQRAIASNACHTAV